MVTATINEDKLGNCLRVPYYVGKEIREKTSTSAEYKVKVIEYYMHCSPHATWGDLAGKLYYMECPEALAVARRFFKRTLGKCVYNHSDVMSNSLISNVNCVLVVTKTVVSTIELFYVLWVLISIDLWDLCLRRQ